MKNFQCSRIFLGYITSYIKVRHNMKATGQRWIWGTKRREKEEGEWGEGGCLTIRQPIAWAPLPAFRTQACNAGFPGWRRSEMWSNVCCLSSCELLGLKKKYLCQLLPWFWCVNPSYKTTVKKRFIKILHLALVLRDVRSRAHNQISRN